MAKLLKESKSNAELSQPNSHKLVRDVLENAVKPLTACEIAKLTKLDTRHVNRILPTIRPTYGARWAQHKQNRRLLFAVDRAAEQLPEKARQKVVVTQTPVENIIEEASKKWTGWGKPPVPSLPRYVNQSSAA